MTSRTTDDYQAMADAGIAAIVEPAFWVGQPRTNVADGVLAMMRRYLDKDGVVAVGEIGYDDQTGDEDRCFRRQIELARVCAADPGPHPLP